MFDHVGVAVTDLAAAAPVGRVDHLWLRLRDPEVSRRFYTTIARTPGSP
jgi:hypothetical protein